jgi:hypothetical protein
LHKSGAPFQIFNLNDLPKININDYKMFVFLNAINIQSDILSIIQKDLRDKYNFFVYASNYASSGKLDFKGIEAITGMSMTPFKSDIVET